MIKIARKNNGTHDTSSQIRTTKFILATNNSNKTQELIPVECGEPNLEGITSPAAINEFHFGSARVIASSTAILNELGKELLQSAREGNPEEIKNLLTRGAPFSADWLGTSPLHLAAQNNHAEVCELLLRAGISIDARTKVDRTPLHMAAYEGHLGIVKIFVKNEADINCRDLLGMTPLHWAAQNGHFKIVEYLVESGADINATNKFTLSATDIAAQVNRNDIIEYINSYANDSTIAAQNLVLQLEAQNEEENDIMEITEESSNEDDPRIVPPVESIFINAGFENDTEQSSCVEEEQNQTIFSSPINMNTSESTYMEDEPMCQSISNVDENGLSDSAIRLLQEHGITMIQTDDDTNILNTVMESGHSVVLTDIGREVLNSVKQTEEEAQLQTTKRIITVTPEEFLAMTNGCSNQNSQNNNHPLNKIKVLPAKQGVKRVVMKKNRVTPVTNNSNIHNEFREIHEVSNKNQKTDVEQIMAQLIEAKKTIEEYKIRLQQKEQEAERYKMQLKLLLDA